MNRPAHRHATGRDPAVTAARITAAAVVLSAALSAAAPVITKAASPMLPPTATVTCPRAGTGADTP